MLTALTFLSHEFDVSADWPTLCGLQALQRLDMSLSGDAPVVRALPIETPGISQLKKLRSLQLRLGNIDMAVLFPAGMVLPELTFLAVEGTPVALDFLQVIASLGSLRQLGLVRCSVSALPPLARLTGLTRLNMSGNPAIADVRSALANVRSLRQLSANQDNGPPLACINRNFVEAVDALPG